MRTIIPVTIASASAVAALGLAACGGGNSSGSAASSNSIVTDSAELTWTCTIVQGSVGGQPNVARLQTTNPGRTAEHVSSLTITYTTASGSLASKVRANQTIPAHGTKSSYIDPAPAAATGCQITSYKLGHAATPKPPAQPQSGGTSPNGGVGGGTGQGSGQPSQPQQPGTAILTCQNPVNGSANCSYASAPTQITLAGDGSLYITVSWAGSTYGGQTATATGEVYGNDCNPSCVAGTFNDEGPGTVTLSDPVDVGGAWYYNDMSVTLPSTDVATAQPIINYGPYTNLAP